ncbi:MAG TPA: PqqD family protein [Bacteroidetes bacterium]|nr:MAG: hypothetical protein A2X66_02435 [Ignavibacteria bacterium GWA2_54_16]HCA81549.1 PqqD family protein [Bacteroidota bacterium]
MFKRKDKKEINLLELMPAQRVSWETAENGTVVVLIPKFHNEFLVRWLVPRLRYPFVRLKLDPLGSFVWKQCDGRTTVTVIAERMQAEFGDSLQQVHNRIRSFLLMLEKTEVVDLHERGTDTLHHEKSSKK